MTENVDKQQREAGGADERLHDADGTSGDDGNSARNATKHKKDEKDPFLCVVLCWNCLQSEGDVSNQAKEYIDQGRG